MIWILPLVLFIIDSVCNIIFSAKHFRKGEYITKPLLIPLLILFAFAFDPSVNRLIIAALCFGFLGDVLLLKSGNFFAAGLFSFLIGHIFYITAFLLTNHPFSLPFWFLFITVPYLIYGGLIYKKLRPNLHEMKVPAFLYLLFILAMSYSSLTLLFERGALMLLPVTGSVLFVASDSILALCTFDKGSKKAEPFIMPTYIAAQFLITLGFIL